MRTRFLKSYINGHVMACVYLFHPMANVQLLRVHIFLENRSRQYLVNEVKCMFNHAKSFAIECGNKRVQASIHCT